MRRSLQALNGIVMPKHVGPIARGSSSTVPTGNGSRDSFSIMTFNVQFYIQFCRVLKELEQLQIDYGPHKRSGLIKSQHGMSLPEIIKQWRQHGDQGFEKYKALPCVQANFRGICELMAQVQPDIVAVQEGRNGLDLRAEAPGFSLETVVSADAPSLQLDTQSIAAAGAVTNQLLLNKANSMITLRESWQLLTKTGGPKDLKTGHPDVPRFAAGVRVEVKGQLLDVVCMHLTGGRVDDMRWKQLRDQRFKENEYVISSKFQPTVPMLIMGDFNAPSTPEEVSSEHARSLGAVTDEDISCFKQYMVGVHDELVNIGWKPAYKKNDLPIHTSVFGSSVDWVYVSPNWPDNWAIGKPRVIDVIHASNESWASYPGGNGLQMSLSDHNPVTVDIEIS